MKRLVIVINILLFLSSCATHNGAISSSSINRNVVYEDIAYGVAQSNKVFGIGGLSQDALVLEAKRELMKNRPLNENEEYLNFTVDFKRTFWPFYSQTKVTLSADVIRPIDEIEYEPYSENYKTKLSRLNLTNDLFSIGDSIYIKKKKKGTVISFLENEKVRVEFKSKKDKVRTKKISIYDIYTWKKPYRELKIGDSYFFPSKGTGDIETRNGKIVGIGLESFLVRVGSKQIDIVEYKD